MKRNYKAQYTEKLTDKQQAKLDAWSAWGDKMTMLRQIHKEVGRDKPIEE
jgi:hypothetical protein